MTQSLAINIPSGKATLFGDCVILYCRLFSSNLFAFG